MRCARTGNKRRSRRAGRRRLWEATGHGNVRSAHPQAAVRRRWLSGCLAVWDTGPLSSVSCGNGKATSASNLERGAFLGISFLSLDACVPRGFMALPPLPCRALRFLHPPRNAARDDTYCTRRGDSSKRGLDRSGRSAGGSGLTALRCLLCFLLVLRGGGWNARACTPCSVQYSRWPTGHPPSSQPSASARRAVQA